MPTSDLELERDSFIAQSGRFLAFPIAGAVVWTVVGILGLLLPPLTARYALVFGSGVIFPLALLVARFTGQRVFIPGNRFANLMGLSVLMVNLLWALHLALLTSRSAHLMPLSLAIGLGLHWIVFGWIIQAPLGLVHAIVRTVLCTVVTFAFPQHSLTAVAFAVVACYAMTMVQLVAFFRRWTPAGARAETAISA
ncbi:hypothetical protein [Opitutus sp. ER46]|uniref:DUF7010 family protein n=1 Tax=Opitutus sp. ER46 TaxID=2161864 RepID=UPI000D322856|nr:hypothetical protein [Opitutus sp. ER46]PTX90677.1 hypothetical protein DB354_18605 [Opitutus sp. ER46]